jgi:hypothetical protein
MIRDLVGRPLKWTQPRALHRHFELRDGEEVVATLGFRGEFGSFATTETADGNRTFKRVGFWQTRVTICVAGTDREIASFRNNTWTAGGTLELADGRKFPANSNFWKSSYEFKNEAGESLVQFRRIGGPFHLSSQVEVRPAAASLVELPWLVALGWYLAIKMHDDAAGGAAAAAG